MTKRSPAYTTDMVTTTRKNVPKEEADADNQLKSDEIKNYVTSMIDGRLKGNQDQPMPDPNAPQPQPAATAPSLTPQPQPAATAPSLTPQPQPAATEAQLEPPKGVADKLVEQNAPQFSLPSQSDLIRQAQQGYAAGALSQQQAFSDSAKGIYESNLALSKQHEQNYKQQKKYIQDLDTQLSKYGTDLTRIEDYKKSVKEIKEITTKSLNEIQNTKIDPNRFWKNRSLGNRIGLAIGVALAGFGPGGNAALSMINKMIDNDLDAQKADVDKKLGGMKTRLEVFKTKFPENPLAAERVWRMQLLEKQIQAQASMTKSKEAMVQAQQMLTTVRTEGAKALTEFVKSRRDFELQKMGMDQDYLLKLSEMDQKNLPKHETKMRVEKLNAASIYLEKILEYITKDGEGFLPDRFQPYSTELTSLVGEYVANKVMGRSGAAFTQEEVDNASNQSMGWLFATKGERLRALLMNELNDIDQTMRIHTGEGYKNFPNQGVRIKYITRKKSIIDKIDVKENKKLRGK